MSPWITVIGSLGAAMIAGLFSFAGIVYSNKKNHDDTINKVNTQIALIQKDIKNLETKQDKHNGLIERMYAAESAINVLEERVKKLESRVDKLEEK